MSEKNEIETSLDFLPEGEVLVPEEVLEELSKIVENTDKPVEAKESEVNENVISLEKPEVTGPGLAPVASGAIGSTQVKARPKPESKTKAKKADVEKVAIHSSRNVTWDGVGKVNIGYNIVTEDQAAKWLERNHIRLATPEEVAKEFIQ
jgi:DNA-binding protein H-NS